MSKTALFVPQSCSSPEDFDVPVRLTESLQTFKYTGTVVESDCVVLQRQLASSQALTLPRASSTTLLTVSDMKVEVGFFDPLDRSPLASVCCPNVLGEARGRV
jgi:hypothetical protein